MPAQSPASADAAQRGTRCALLSRISDNPEKHKKLLNNKLTAEKLQSESWMQLLIYAGTAFVRAGVFEKAAEA
jgi:hypothetical protein